jgi:hypothetical protein
MDKNDDRLLEDRMSRFERRMILLTVAGVFVAVVTGCIFLVQAYLMRRQLKAMEKGSVDTHNLVEASKAEASNLKRIAKSTADNVEAARKFARASEANIRAMKLVARLEQRAWVGVSGVKVSKLQVGKPVLISVEFRNTGKTPAKNLTVVSNLEVVPRAGKPNFTYSSEGSSPPERDSRVLLLAGGYAHISFEATKYLQQKEIDDVATGQLSLYVHGLAKYDDTFGTHHWIRFCYFMDRDVRSFVICREHNSADAN